MGKKEYNEWIHSQCSEANCSGKPRVLLIGDSICNGYQPVVRAKLWGTCFVDYLSTSYTLDSKMFEALVYGLVKDSEYDLIHINQGLHGIHLTKKTYKSNYKKLIKKLTEKYGARLVLATTTPAYKEGNKLNHPDWTKRVKVRNIALNELAEEFNLPVNDLFAVAKSLKITDRAQDGVHYEQSGYEVLGTAVVDMIKKQLNLN